MSGPYKWISIKENNDNLPKRGSMCLCWLHKRKETVICKYEEDKNGSYWDEIPKRKWLESFMVQDSLTHWMYLPSTDSIENKS